MRELDRLPTRLLRIVSSVMHFIKRNMVQRLHSSRIAASLWPLGARRWQARLDLEQIA